LGGDYLNMRRKKMKALKKLRKARKVRKRRGPTYHCIFTLRIGKKRKFRKKVFCSDDPDFIPF
jgi:hypothetical protein